MSNASVAQILYEIADLLDMKGDVFKRNAYRRAAQSIENLDVDVKEFYDRNALTEVSGVGDGIAKKIAQIIDTGESSYLNGLRDEFPPGFIEMMRIPDIGPKTLERLRKELGVNNIGELKKAALAHRIRRMKGFGEKSEESILRGIEMVEKQMGRMLLGLAYPISQDIIEYMRSEGCSLLSVAGSLRRMKETVGDLDLLVGSDEAERVMSDFTSHPYAARIIAKGLTKTSISLANGVQATFESFLWTATEPPSSTSPGRRSTT